MCTAALLAVTGCLPSHGVRATLLQPTAVVAALFMLPAGVRWLELDVSPCAGLLLPALARFTRLQELIITNGADISWSIGPAAALAPLSSLGLDCRNAPLLLDENHYFRADHFFLPPSALPVLSAATALHYLELRAAWSDEMAQLCHTLPALRSLK